MNLYMVKLQGIVTKQFASNCSPGVTYVIAETPSQAYEKVLASYSDDGSLGDVSDLQLYSITVVATDAVPNRAGPEMYKLVI